MIALPRRAGLEKSRAANIRRGEPSMKVHRIVANIQTDDVAKAEAFYRDVLGLELVMDHGWLRTYASSEKMTVQVSFATQGGSDTPVPDLSIEVDDVEVALRRVREAGLPVEYGPKSEPWGVRRFYVRDQLGKLVNVMQHE
jgi:lactoylglutathione lyase